MNKEEIVSHIEAFTKGKDLYVVDVQLSPSKLAVFIDKPAGVLLEECMALNRYLLTELEPSGFCEKHAIEVSSPGMDMPLKVPRQYLRRVGQEIKVIDIEGKEIKGTLQSADDECFEILAVTEKKEKKEKIRTETVKKFMYNEVRETKLIFNFKIK